MPRKKKPQPRHSIAERKRLRHIQRKTGPSALRRKQRRAHLQPKKEEGVA